MDVNKVITQLRTFCPMLGNRVGGAANFDTAEGVVGFTDPATGKPVYPAAVVVPLEDDAARDDDLSSLTQLTVTEKIAVIVEFDASSDRRGQGAVDQVEAMKYALYRALLNWYIDQDIASQGLYYVGGQLLSFDRARVFWQFVFALDVTITDADGFQTSGDPLTNISTDPAAPPIIDGAFDFPVSIPLT
jgi:hypothetical protein